MNMAARQRSNNGRWFVDFRFSHKRYRLISPENSKKGAQAFESFLRSNLAKGIPVEEVIEEEEKTFYEFAEYWFRTYVETNNKPTTKRAKRMTLNAHLYPHFKDLKLSEITSMRIERLKAEKLKSGLSVKTVNNILSTLRVCLNTAFEWNELKAMPKIKWLKVSDQPFDFLNEEECLALLNAAQTVIERDMLLCAMRTGMRRGELLGLEWSSVDFARNKIVVQQSYVEGHLHSTKNNRIRYIPMSADLRHVLMQRKKLKGFVFSETEKPVRGIMASKWLYKLCERAEMRSIGWHVLRHTFASHLVMKGVPMRAVQMLLGHSSIQMTERYSHLAPSTLHDAVAVLDKSETLVFRDFGHHMGTDLKVISASQTENV